MLIKKSTLAVVGTVLALGLWQANQSSLSIAGLSWDSRDQPERVEDLIAPQGDQVAGYIWDKRNQPGPHSSGLNQLAGVLWDSRSGDTERLAVKLKSMIAGYIWDKRHQPAPINSHRQTKTTLAGYSWDTRGGKDKLAEPTFGPYLAGYSWDKRNTPRHRYPYKSQLYCPG